MTIKLYEEDAYLRGFEGRVLGCKRDEKGLWLKLDQTAFYPEGGGQPGDRGTLLDGLQAYPVLDTQKDEDESVLHLICGEEAPQPGSILRGEIDWARRYTFMQQHTGEHLLANCIFAITGGQTRGLHIGHEDASIDVEMPKGATFPNAETVRRIEEEANRRIEENAPIRCWFPDPHELASLPLRKPPTVTKRVRIVQAGDYERVACGGTHLKNTSEALVLKVLKTLPARGKWRVHFVCGGRAYRHYAESFESAGEAARALSCPVSDLPRAILRLQEEGAALKREIRDLKNEKALSRLPELLARAERLSPAVRLAWAELEEDSADALELLASCAIKEEGLLILLCAGERLSFACSRGVQIDCPKLLRDSGAKGGGTADFARGKGQGPENLFMAIQLLHNSEGLKMYTIH